MSWGEWGRRSSRCTLPEEFHPAGWPEAEPKRRLLTASASFASGALFGFLFGIPRSLAGRQDNGAKDRDDKANRMIEPNTNLEQISDWLTKILVGVGLVQLQQISQGIGHLADGLAPGLGGDPNGPAVAVTLMISFSIAGFVCAYLYTRLRLQSAFALADVIDAAVGERADTETKALALVRSQLDPGGDGPTQKELSAALKAASSGIRAQAFYLARDQRRANWWNGDKQLVGQTVPVYRALIECDPERRFHRNYGELGYALKDRENPDYSKARESLSTAIEIRGASGASRHPLYELNRAVCNIVLDRAFWDGKASDAATTEAVVTDLLVAVNTKLGRKALKGDKNAQKWLQLNSADPGVVAVNARVMQAAES